ncbi:hypothetical protein PHSC3_000588 [Chlamydiales bacterium STE3]|nr:hypothetical protein PHSC3_000588 [Chlamydiales bacterium STE3]
MDKVKLNFCNFFTYFAVHPISKNLSPCDKKIALLGSSLLFFVGFGCGHLFCEFILHRNILKIKALNKKLLTANEKENSSLILRSLPSKELSRQQKEPLIPLADLKLSRKCEANEPLPPVDHQSHLKIEALNKKLLTANEKENASLILRSLPSKELSRQQKEPLIPLADLKLSRKCEANEPLPPVDHQSHLKIEALNKKLLTANEKENASLILRSLPPQELPPQQKEPLIPLINIKLSRKCVANASLLLMDHQIHDKIKEANLMAFLRTGGKSVAVPDEDRLILNGLIKERLEQYCEAIPNFRERLERLEEDHHWNLLSLNDLAQPISQSPIIIALMNHEELKALPLNAIDALSARELEVLSQRIPSLSTKSSSSKNVAVFSSVPGHPKKN